MSITADRARQIEAELNEAAPLLKWSVQTHAFDPGANIVIDYRVPINGIEFAGRYEIPQEVIEKVDNPKYIISRGAALLAETMMNWKPK